MMVVKMPAATWEADYQHDRRAQASLTVLSRIVEAGERGIFARVGAEQTRAIHASCAGSRLGSCATSTWANAMQAWRTECWTKGPVDLGRALTTVHQY